MFLHVFFLKAALQQMQNAVEIHEQFDQVVSRTTQWLESLTSKLNNLSANDNTDRVGLEQNLLTCQVFPYCLYFFSFYE